MGIYKQLKWKREHHQDERNKNQNAYCIEISSFAFR